MHLTCQFDPYVTKVSVKQAYLLNSEHLEQNTIEMATQIQAEIRHKLN